MFLVIFSNVWHSSFSSALVASLRLPLTTSIKKFPKNLWLVMISTFYWSKWKCPGCTEFHMSHLKLLGSFFNDLGVIHCCILEFWNLHFLILFVRVVYSLIHKTLKAKKFAIRKGTKIFLWYITYAIHLFGILDREEPPPWSFIRFGHR